MLDSGPRRPGDAANRCASLIALGSSVVAAVLLAALLVVVSMGVLSRELDVQLLRNHEELAGYLMAA